MDRAARPVGELPRARVTDAHDHHHPRPASEVELRARALEALLAERGLVSTDAIDAIVELYENDVGPQNGARVVARAWVDEAYRARLLNDSNQAIAELGFGGAEGDNMVVVANDAGVHNMVVCTLCSCYPWPVLGLPPTWYKSPPYRARAVSEPRAVLREFGVELGGDVEIRVWDSSAEVRYLVLPMRPDATRGWSEDQLAAIVTRDCMIGTALPSASETPGS
jgi:nitrile hydratase subunit alpha